MKTFRLECFDVLYNKVDDPIDEAITIELHVFHSTTNEDCKEIGSILRRCKKLRRIKVICNLHSTIDEESIAALFGSDEDYGNRDATTPFAAIESLDLKRAGIGAGGVRALVPFLQYRKQLNELDLGSNDIGNEGARILGEVLEEVCVQKLILFFDEIGKEGLERIFSSRIADSVKTLDLDGNPMGRVEMEEISRFLERRDTSIAELSLSESFQVWDIQWVESLLQSLRKNATLSTLRLCAYRVDTDVGNDVPNPPDLLSGQFKRCSSREAIIDRIKNAILALVCDSSSLDAFCNSNHVIRTLKLQGNELFMFDLPLKVQLALDINGGYGSTNTKLRRKLRSIYFRGRFDTKEFSSMKSVWMPFALSLVTRSEKLVVVGDEGKGNGKRNATPEKNLNAIYNIIREPKNDRSL